MGRAGAKRSFHSQAHALVAARCPLVYVETHEEARLERILRALAAQIFKPPAPVYTWSLTEGLTDGQKTFPGSEDPVAALSVVLRTEENALFLFRDLHLVMTEPRVTRRLRDVFRAQDDAVGYRTVFLCGPILKVPVELEKSVAVLDLPVPGVQELDRIFEQVCADQDGIELVFGDERDAFLRGALGLTEEEARAAFRRILLGRTRVGPEVIPALFEEKRTIVRKEGILEYVEPRISLDDVGGLQNLKLWLRQRRRMFASEAEETGLDLPRGLLVTGISGCGKTFAVKAIAAYWRLPLIRLDMNRIYAAVAGTPERTLERAIRTAEAIAPCVLWIDEIETALLGTHGDGGGQATRIFSSFLTWMQEKEEMVFVAATANEIDKLPPEMLRKGRFDQVFFVDLPSENEREEILRVHLRRRHLDPEAYEVPNLAKATSGFNGAELEQLVLHGMYAAFGQDRSLDIQDLYEALTQMVPLSRTMVERIKAIKRWADTRAVKANAAK